MIRIDARYCKGCGICIRFCERRVLDLSDDVNSLGYYMPCVVDAGECNDCRQCELLCPDFAIFVVGDDKDKEG